jgi:DNA-binding GntR family transcriptional regulator
VANTVAVGTAHRALTLLKDERLIEVTRGRRATVATVPAQSRCEWRATTSAENGLVDGCQKGLDAATLPC